MYASWTELLYRNTADFTALDTFTAEASLLAGTNLLPVIPAFFFNQPAGRALKIMARGVLSSTGTPTYTFQARLGTTAGSAYLSGTSVGVSAALTTASGASAKQWRLEIDLICTIPGNGTTTCTIAGAGQISSSGLASPFIYPMPDSATWTYTLDGGLNQFLNLSVTCSASDAANTIRCKQLLCLALN